jgi:hypothetical protein
MVGPDFCGVFLGGLVIFLVGSEFYVVSFNPQLEKKAMIKKLGELVKNTHVLVTFKDESRNKVTIATGERKLPLEFDFSRRAAKCDCLSAEAGKFSCGYMTLAAEKNGKPWADLLYP